MWDMIIVVEKRDVVTRICSNDGSARALHALLRQQMREEGWLAVTLAMVVEQPYRSAAEVERARAIMNLRGSGS